MEQYNERKEKVNQLIVWLKETGYVIFGNNIEILKTLLSQRFREINPTPLR